MQQVAAQMASGMESAMAQAMDQLGANLQNAFQVDADAFANAIQMNMSEEELAELLQTLMSGEDASYEGNLASFGYADLDDPSEISIYPLDFSSKESIVGLLEDYNSRMEAQGEEDKVISYTDVVGTLMSSVTEIVDMISYVLVAFVAISLVVSSIMIGVITYISVLERKKRNRYPPGHRRLQTQYLSGVQCGDLYHWPVRRLDRHRPDADPADTRKCHHPHSGQYHPAQRRPAPAARCDSDCPQRSPHVDWRPDPLQEGGQERPGGGAAVGVNARFRPEYSRRLFQRGPDVVCPKRLAECFGQPLCHRRLEGQIAPRGDGGAGLGAVWKRIALYALLCYDRLYEFTHPGACAVPGREGRGSAHGRKNYPQKSHALRHPAQR